MDLKLSLAGLLVGILVGATGMGGGSLMTPLLVLGFGFNPTVAVGTDLFHGALFKSLGALRHRRLGTVQAQLSGWMLLGSGPMALVGVWLATELKDRYGSEAVNIQTVAIAVALIVGGMGTLLKSIVRFRERPDVSFVMTTRDRLAAFVIGLFGGFVVGLTSVGSGVFFGLTLLIVFPLRSSKVVGTDILHAAALLWIAGMGHLVAGNVDLTAVGALLIGSIPGVLIGSSVTTRVPDRSLRIALAGVLLISGIKLLNPPYSNEVVVGGLGSALVVLAVFAARRFAASRISLSRNRDRRLPSPNVRWQRLDLDKRARSELKGQKAGVVWLTGLSGAGKSTIANLLDGELYSAGKHTYVLDGDNVRHGLNRDLGFSDEDREENIRRVAEVARLMVDAGLIVIVAFISPFRSDRHLARSLFADGEFIEVFVDAPLDVAEFRDPKGLYKKARAGELRNFTGIESPYEPPEAPEVHLDTVALSPETAAGLVMAELAARGLVHEERVVLGD